ncbi:MAG: TonB-dependent receptor [Bacteroidales bacterium]|jgi:hemoglobin/transferrin/lactoferrin receptor protein|nr:TonB-dependent receptor [Bacteroidales bacterium]
MKKTVIFIAILLLAKVGYPQPFDLSGNVFSKDSGEPLSGVNIKLVGDSLTLTQYTTTDLEGTYLFSTLQPGRYQLTFSYLGFITQHRSLQLTSDTEVNVSMENELIPLGEVVVTSLRQERRIKDVPLPLEVVGSASIEEASSLTASDIIGEQPGIQLSRDGMWSTSINIRGFGEQRIVTLVDGNRIETATDLTAAMSFFDVDDIERVEVIKGASSSLYGTGAMGGIVNIITKDGAFNTHPYFKGSFHAGVYSVNDLFTGKLTLNGGGEKWYARVSGSLRNANDVNTPEGTIPNSQFKDKNVTASAGYKVNKNQTLKLKFHHVDADDVGIPGGSAFPGPATATYTDAQRTMFSANYEINNISESFESLNIKYFHQSILRDVRVEPNIVSYSPDSTRRTTPQYFTPYGLHITDGFQLQSDWSFGINNKFIAGMDVWRRKLETDREKFILMEVLDGTGNVLVANNIVRGETPIPEACFGSAGLYFQNEQYMFNDRLKVTLGGRLDGIRIANEEGYDVDYIIMNDVLNETPPNQRITFEENEEYKLSWSANLGFLYALTDEMDLSFSAGRSFRAPSLEESFKYIDLGNYVRLGDPELDPEKGYTLDLGWRIWKPKFQFKVNTFANWITDMIVEKEGEFIYSYTTGVVDTIGAFINTNVDNARLYGVDLNFQYNFYGNFVLHGAGAYVRGEDLKNNENLPLIPPMNGRLGLRYTLPEYFGADFIATGYADQDQVAEGETETKGFARFDLRIHSKVISFDFAKLQLFGGIENIGDRAYRNHLSTNRGAVAIEPGRNYYLKLKVFF